jgi:hypothetical protein
MKLQPAFIGHDETKVSSQKNLDLHVADFALKNVV